MMRQPRAVTLGARIDSAALQGQMATSFALSGLRVFSLG
jgi:hypothetical protein